MILVSHSPRKSCLGTFVFDSPALGVDGRNALMHYHKIRYSFDYHGGLGGYDALLNGPDENAQIQGHTKNLDSNFRFIPRTVIYRRSGFNPLSERMRVILNSQCRYNLCTCVIPPSLFFNFRLLIIIPAANMMYRGMVLSKPIPLICMRSHKIVTSLYLSRMILGTLGILTDSTC